MAADIPKAANVVKTPDVMKRETAEPTKGAEGVKKAAPEAMEKEKAEIKKGKAAPEPKPIKPPHGKP